MQRPFRVSHSFYLFLTIPSDFPPACRLQLPGLQLRAQPLRWWSFASSSRPCDADERGEKALRRGHCVGESHRIAVSRSRVVWHVWSMEQVGVNPSMSSRIISMLWVVRKQVVVEQQDSNASNPNTSHFVPWFQDEAKYCGHWTASLVSKDSATPSQVWCRARCLISKALDEKGTRTKSEKIIRFPSIPKVVIKNSTTPYNSLLHQTTSTPFFSQQCKGYNKIQ